MAAKTVKRALPSMKDAKPASRGVVKKALPDREVVVPKKSRGKVRAALGRKSSR